MYVGVEQVLRAGEAHELALEAGVAEHSAAPLPDRADGGEQRHLAVDHHVGDTHGRAPVDPHRAVHQHCATSPLCRIDEAERLVEVTRDVVAVTVVSGELMVVDVESVVRRSRRVGRPTALVRRAVEHVRDVVAAQQTQAARVPLAADDHVGEQ